MRITGTMTNTTNDPLLGVSIQEYALPIYLAWTRQGVLPPSGYATWEEYRLTLGGTTSVGSV